MAQQKSKRRSRKARAANRPAPAVSATPTPPTAQPRSSPKTRVAPKVAPVSKQPTRRQLREERERQTIQKSAQASRQLGTFGPSPKSIFAPIPVSEIAIFAGLIGVIVGLINKGSIALPVGACVCALGVLEFTAREHFSGYRSHTTLLAAFPAVVMEVILALEVGEPTKRILLLLPVVPVFGVSFWLLHRWFRGARHARVVRSPAP